MAVIGWFACKSLSDWVRYLVIVTCTGKSGIFWAQPVSLRGSNPDYSGRSASRVNVKKITLICMQLVMISLKQLRCRKNKPYFLNGSSYFSAIYSSVGLIINVNLHLDLVTQSFTIIYIHHTSLSSFDAQILCVCVCLFHHFKVVAWNESLLQGELDEHYAVCRCRLSWPLTTKTLPPRWLVHG